MNGRKVCKGCDYYRSIDHNNKGCHYCIDTGEPRGCPVEQCDKYRKTHKGKPKGAALYV